jgi:hypothetical protein
VEEVFNFGEKIFILSFLDFLGDRTLYIALCEVLKGKGKRHDITLI